MLDDALGGISNRSTSSHSTSLQFIVSNYKRIKLDTIFQTFKVGNTEDIEEEGPKLKDIMCDYIKKGCDYCCVLDCCKVWIKIAKLFSWFVFDPFTELFITLCIAVNVVFMSLDHYSIEYDGM